jgi:hypothetical protein
VAGAAEATERFGDAGPDGERDRRFRSFLAAVGRSVPAELEIHVIPDGGAVCDRPTIRAWLATRPRYRLGVAPSSASWLAEVERWITLTSRRRTERGTGQGVRELAAAIARHAAARADDDHRPFVWIRSAGAASENAWLRSGSGHHAGRAPDAAPGAAAPEPDPPAAAVGGPRRRSRHHHPSTDQEVA